MESAPNTGLTAVSVHGFAGAFAFALKELGIELLAVLEPGGFGTRMIEANRDVLGYTGPIYTMDPNRVPAYDTNIVLGNPPCSGFSLLNSSKGDQARGPEAKINECMWTVVRYAARVNEGKGADAVIWESVQGTGKMGLGLMRDLHTYLREETGEDYALTHLFMSGASVGGAQIRKRYFWVATKKPFGIVPPEIPKVTTYRDAIGDLVGLRPTYDAQPTNLPPSEWAERLVWKHEGEPWVTCHVLPEDRYAKMMDAIAKYWLPGQDCFDAIKAFIANEGHPPEHWNARDIQWATTSNSFSKTYRIKPDRAGRVIAGDGAYGFYHWEEDRLLTVRELARLMGFPDESRWAFASIPQMYAMLGKQVPVQSWAWALSWVTASIQGYPGWYRGDVTGLNERTIDVTNDFKRVYNERTGVQEDSRSPELKRLMDERRP